MVSLDDMRPYKKARLLNGLNDIITLEVGEGDNLTKFAVHKSILCSSSPFFETACKPEWMKAEDRVVKLPKDDPTAVRAMVYWMYHDAICISSEMNDAEDFHTENDSTKTVSGLFAKLYVLGEKYQIPRLKNDAIDAILYHYESTGGFRIEISSYVYANMPGDSPFRKLLVRFALYLFDDIDLESIKRKLCDGLIFDLAKVSLGDEFKDKKGRIDCEHPGNGFCDKFHLHPEATRGKCKALKAYFVDF